MNIQAINNVNFMASPKQLTRIKRVNDVGTYVEQLLSTCSKEVEQKAENFGKTVKLASSGDVLLINSGNLTSTFNTNPYVKVGGELIKTKDLPKGYNPQLFDEIVNERSKVLLDTIENNIKGNVIAEERGLKKGIEYIEINAPTEVFGSKLNISV